MPPGGSYSGWYGFSVVWFDRQMHQCNKGISPITFRTSPDRVDAKASLVMIDGNDLLNVYIKCYCLLVLIHYQSVRVHSLLRIHWHYASGNMVLESNSITD